MKQKILRRVKSNIKLALH